MFYFDLFKHTFNSLIFTKYPTPFWYRGVDSTQYEKGQYAVRKHPVISYANIKFYFNSSFHQETQQTL